MKVILGTGQLGLAVVAALLKNNPADEIVLVNRTGKVNETFPANIQLVAADVTDSYQLECLARETDVIFNCTDVPYQRWADFYPATATALAYALSKTAARLVFADNLYSYGNVFGEVMHETMSHQAKTKKGKIRSAVINRLLLSGDAFNSRVAIVKAADFIGPRIYKGMFGLDFLNKLYQGKTVFLFGKPQLPHTFTYIKDVAVAMVTIANAPDAFEQIWHVPNAAAISPNQWVKLFEEATGRKASINVLPNLLIRMAGLFNSLVRELYELAYQVNFPYLVDHSKYVARFGNHSTPRSVIIQETIAWYNQQASLSTHHSLSALTLPQ